MAEWSSEACEYLDGYLKQVSVLVRQQGDDPEDVVAGLRDHIANEVESDGETTVTLEQLLNVLSDLGSPEAVASVDPAALKHPSTKAVATPVPPAPPRVSKSVIVHRHRSPVSCLLAIILAPFALMVIVAVLGILASIFLPALSRSREAVRRAECQDNLKQIGQFLSAYSADHEGELPPIDLSYSRIMFDVDLLSGNAERVPNVFVCPSGTNADQDFGDENGFDHDYIYFTHVVSDADDVSAYLQAVQHAKETNTPIPDEIALPEGGVLRRIRVGDSVPANEIPLLIERCCRHVPKGSNVLFLDGHVQYRKYGEGIVPSVELPNAGNDGAIIEGGKS